MADPEDKSARKKKGQQPVSHEETKSEREILDYWTEERMDEAVPVPMPGALHPPDDEEAEEPEA